MSETSAPAAPGALIDGIEPLPPKPLKRNPLFTDVDAAADEAIAKAKPSAPAAKPKPRTGPPTKAERRSAEAEVDGLLNEGFGVRGREVDDDDTPDDDDDDDPITEPAVPRKKPKPPPAEEPEVEDGDDEREPAEERAEPEMGTKKKPFKRDDLPEDQFVELKINGEKHVVNVKELADDYSGRKAIAQKLAKLGEERATMTRHVEEARSEVKANGAYFEKLIRDPDKLYEMLASNDQLEGTLQRIFERRYNDLTAWQNDPTSRAKFIYERGQRALDNQRRMMEARQQQAQQESQRAAAEQHRARVLEPGWNEGLRRAGLFGQKIEHPEFVKTAQLWLSRREAELGDEPVTLDDVARAVTFTAKFLGVRPANAPPPRPRLRLGDGAPPQQRRPTSGRAPNGQNWDEVPRAKKSMDPEYLSRGMRLRG